MKVTVTGGAGFIGANLCRTLVAHPGIRKVVVLDDLSTGLAANLDGLSVELQVGSILDERALAQAVAGADAIVHLAARASVPRSLADPIATHEVNATGTMRVLEAARREACHVVVASSSSVYGANPDLPKREDQVPMPMSPYAASKLAAESSALAYQWSFGLPVLAFRFFNVFGPLQPAGHAYAAVIPAFVSAALRGEPVPINGDGHQSRDFTYVDTVTAVITDAVVRGVTASRPVNLAMGERTNLLGLVDVLEGLLGRPLERQHLGPRVGDVRHSHADTTVLRTLFPGVPAVPLAQGLTATIEWLQQH